MTDRSPVVRATPTTKSRRAKPERRRPKAVPGRAPNPAIVGSSLKQLRQDRGLSLERLSKLAGVSRAMLGQIELGHSVPTITVIWKIARALGVPFSTLVGGEAKPKPAYLERGQTRLLVSQTGAMSSRALYPLDQARTVEFYELRLKPLAEERSEAHAAGTVENLVVATGTLELIVGTEKTLLGTGDAAVYQADLPHAYRNLGNAEALLYVVIGYGKATS